MGKLRVFVIALKLLVLIVGMDKRGRTGRRNVDIVNCDIPVVLFANFCYQETIFRDRLFSVNVKSLLKRGQYYSPFKLLVL